MAEDGIDNRILLALTALIAGVYGWLIKHLSNSKKHPCADNLVYRDTCEQTVKRLEDCIEGQVKLETMRYEALTKRVDEGFADLKELIKNGR